MSETFTSALVTSGFEIQTLGEGGSHADRHVGGCRRPAPTRLAPVRFTIANRVGGGGATAASYIVNKKGDPHVIGLYTSVPDFEPAGAARSRCEGFRHDLDRAAPARAGRRDLASWSPYKTLKDLIEAAKAKPGTMKQSGGSPLARDALVQHLLMAKTGAKWSYIGFPGGGERIAALLGGHVDLMIAEPSEAAELVRAGKVRAVAQIAGKRLPGWEQVPTLSEAGFDIVDVPQARGIIAPPGMPAEAVAYYQDLFQRVSKSEAFDKYTKDTNTEGAYLNAKDNAAFLKDYENTLRDVLKTAGIKTVR